MKKNSVLRVWIALLATVVAGCGNTQDAPATDAAPADPMVPAEPVAPAEPMVTEESEHPVASEEVIEEVAEVSVNPGGNDRFLAEDLDVDMFVGIFEGESREISVHHTEITATLGLSEGMSVADIGSGTGLFLSDLGTAVGEAGTVFAVDISPKFIEHLEARAAEENLPQVKTVLCTDHSTELQTASVDVAFVCDTYHHFEYPPATLGSLFDALRPGGLLVIVDFERIPGVTSDWLMGHVRANKETFRGEIEAAGFVFEDEVNLEGLSENYILRFRRP